MAKQSRTFEETFPELKDAIVDYRAARPGGSFADERPLSTLRIRMSEHGPLLHCLNPACREGGYDVTAIIREMLGANETEREGRVVCTGREAEPGRAWEQCTSCNWAWDLKITLLDGHAHASPEWRG